MLSSDTTNISRDGHMMQWTVAPMHFLMFGVNLVCFPRFNEDDLCSVFPCQVPDFNMGAMENKSLNVSYCLLGSHVRPMWLLCIVYGFRLQ